MQQQKINNVEQRKATFDVNTQIQTVTTKRQYKKQKHIFNIRNTANIYNKSCTENTSIKMLLLLK